MNNILPDFFSGYLSKVVPLKRSLSSQVIQVKLVSGLLFESRSSKMELAFPDGGKLTTMTVLSGVKPLPFLLFVNN